MKTVTMFCMVLVFLAVSARAEIFEIQAGADGNLVVFESKAPMESFQGKTRQVSGTIEADLSQLADSLRFRIEVDLASLDTGIGLRNQHMRNNHLETDDYPVAVFAGGVIKSSSANTLTPGSPTTVKLVGDMTLHGVKRTIEVDIQLSLNEGGILNVTSEFALNLSDYDIKRPKFLVLKLADEQKVRVELAAQPVTMNVSN